MPLHNHITATEMQRRVEEMLRTKHLMETSMFQQQHMQDALAYGIGVTPLSNYQYETPGALLKAIAQRLRVPEGANIGGFETVYAHKSGEKVIVFVVHSDGKYVVIEDDWTLFPSDTLITQLRMLKG